jgi:flagellar biosynthesis protein
MNDRDVKPSEPNDQHPVQRAAQQAVALKYEGGSHAPQIVAKGEGAIAEDIIALAQEHQILLHQDAALSQMLQQFNLGESIPPELYHVIAELIAFAYVLQGKFPEQWHNVHQHIDFKE